MRIQRLSKFLILMMIGSCELLAKPGSGPKPVVSAKNSEVRIFILAIGAGTFTNNFWPALEFPASDAARFAAEVGIGTERERTVVSILGKEATRDRVESQLKAWRTEIRPRDQVVIYISSHGSLAINNKNDLEPVIVLGDTDPNKLLSTGLPQSRLFQYVDSLASKNKLVVLASCYSGVGKSRLTEEVNRLMGRSKGAIPDLSEVSQGTMVLAAASRGEVALEDRKIGADVYTHFFLNALTAGDRNADGSVSALEAHDYSKQKTYEYTKGRQRATLSYDAIGDADMVLRGTKTKGHRPILRAYDESYTGISLDVNQAAKGILPSGFPLQPGKNRIRLFRDGSETPFAEYEVSASESETLDLKNLAKPPWWMIGHKYGRSYYRSSWLSSQDSDKVIQGIWLAYRDFGGKMVFDYDRLTGRQEFRTNVVAVAHTDIFSLGIHKDFTIYKMWSADIGANLSYGVINVKLMDKSMSDFLTFKDAGMGGGIAGSLTYEFNFGLGLGVQARLDQAKDFDMGDFGQLSRSGYRFDLMGYYSFGRNARRIK